MTVKQEFQAVGDQTIVNALNRISGGFDKLTDAVNRSTKASRQGADDAARRHAAFDAVIRKQIMSVGGLATSWLSVQGVIQALNTDMERTVQLQNQAAEAQGKLAKGHAEIFLNTFGQSPENKQKIMEAAQRISAGTGVPEEAVAASLGRQAGRGVGISLEQIIDAQEMATRLGRHTPEQIEPLSTVIQQTMRATGKDVKWSAALAQSGAAAAFPGDPRLQSRFLQQALTGSLANIEKPDAAAAEQIFELAAALSQAGGEERGEAGRTATIALLAQFDEFREGRGKWLRQSPWGGKAQLNPVTGAPSNPGDMIEFLRDNPAQMKRFFDKASFEQHYEGIIRRMIMQPNSQVGKLYSDTRAAVGPDQAALEQQLADLDERSQSAQVRRETLASKGHVRIEQAKSRLDRDAVTAQLRKDRDEALSQVRQAGLTPFGNLANMATTGLGDWPSYFSNTQAEHYLEDLKQKRSGLYMGLARGQPFGPSEGSQADFNRLHALLSKLIENGERQLAELKRQNDRSPSAAPAMNMQRGMQSER